jgi:hypothetical protein
LIGHPDIADTPIYKKLQNGRNIMVSVEFATLGQGVDGVKTSRAPNNNDHYCRWFEHIPLAFRDLLFLNESFEFMVSGEIKSWLIGYDNIMAQPGCLNVERVYDISQYLHSRPLLTFRQNMRHSLKVPYDKSKDLRRLPVNSSFVYMGQPVYVSDRGKWLFSQDDRGSLIDFITCLDLLVGGRMIIWTGTVHHINTM